MRRLRRAALRRGEAFVRLGGAPRRKAYVAFDGGVPRGARAGAPRREHGAVRRAQHAALVRRRLRGARRHARRARQDAVASRAVDGRRRMGANDGPHLPAWQVLHARRGRRPGARRRGARRNLRNPHALGRGQDTGGDRRSRRPRKDHRHPRRDIAPQDWRQGELGEDRRGAGEGAVGNRRRRRPRQRPLSILRRRDGPRHRPSRLGPGGRGEGRGGAACGPGASQSDRRRDQRLRTRLVRGDDRRHVVARDPPLQRQDNCRNPGFSHPPLLHSSTPPIPQSHNSPLHGRAGLPHPRA